MTKYFCDRCGLDMPRECLSKISVKLKKLFTDDFTKEYEAEYCAPCLRIVIAEFDKFTKKIEGPQDE